MQHAPEISLDGREPISRALLKAAAAAEAGVGSIWLATHLFARDSISTAAIMLERHPSVNIVLTAVSPFTVHPVHIAMIAATLDEAFPGRVSLCLGVGAPDDLSSARIDASRPLGAMTEALTICRNLLDGERVEVEGQRFGVAARGLDHGAHKVPIILAASGPKMMQLAASMADGVLLSAGSSPAFVSQCLDVLQAEQTPRDGFANCGFVYSAVSEDEAAAFDRLRPKLAMSLRGRHHAENLALAGSTLDQESLRQAVAAGRMDAANALMSDDTIRRHAVVGRPENFARGIADYRQAGLQRVVLAGLGSAEEINMAVAAVRARSA